MNILFHPIVLHFPIALFYLETLLLFFWVIKKEDDCRRFALFTFRVGYFSLLVTLIAGWIDMGGAEHLEGIVRVHFCCALGVFILYTVRAFYWRFAKAGQAGYLQVLITSAVAGNILIAITGYFGGRLVYSS